MSPTPARRRAAAALALVDLLDDVRRVRGALRLQADQLEQTRRPPSLGWIAASSAEIVLASADAVVASYGALAPAGWLERWAQMRGRAPRPAGEPGTPASLRERVAHLQGVQALLSELDEHVRDSTATPGGWTPLRGAADAAALLAR